MNGSLTVGSLFTGVGGFDLGLERAGHEIVFQCEIDRHARAVLRRHWPDVELHDDVSTFERDGTVDLLCGGFPCQDLSLAGKRAGLAGERSGLFFEAVRIAESVLDDGGWILIENVPGLLSSNDGRDFGIVLASLAERGFFDLAWRVLDSRYFGVPQRRRRVFILARRDRGRRAAEILFDAESGGGNSPASRATRTETSETSRSEHPRNGRRDNGTVSPAVTSKWSKGTGGPAGDECQNLVSPTLTTRFQNEQNGAENIVAHTLTTRWRSGDDGGGRGTPLAACSATDADGVRETPGLSGRMDDSVTCPFDPKPDGHRYVQMGNAVTVPVAEWIGRRLRMAES
jgi:DNA (cytosine-5)-methyltransferase 1